MTLVGLEYLKHQENRRHNTEQERLTKLGQENDLTISRERNQSQEKIASLDRQSRADIASLDRESRETIAYDDRQARIDIAEADRKSREKMGWAGIFGGLTTGIATSFLRNPTIFAAPPKEDEKDEDNTPPPGGHTQVELAPEGLGANVVDYGRQEQDKLWDGIPAEPIGNVLRGVATGAVIGLGVAMGGGGAPAFLQQKQFDDYNNIGGLKNVK